MFFVYVTFIVTFISRLGVYLDGHNYLNNKAVLMRQKLVNC